MTQIYTNLYLYTPSAPLAATAALIFLILTLLHAYQLIRTKTWYLIAFLLGGVGEVVGYISRAYSAHQSPNYTLVPYAISTVTILVSPSLLAASLYMGLGRIVRMTPKGKEFLIMRLTWMTKIFVAGDVLSFVTQAAGASLLTQQSADSQKTGTTVVKVGLAMQIVFFAVFLIAATVFYVRQRGADRAGRAGYDAAGVPWRKHLSVLFIAALLIFVRCIYRMVEYVEGKEGYLFTHEWPAYVFDALLVALVMVIYAIVHPSEVIVTLKGDGVYVRYLVRTKRVKVAEAGEWHRLEIS